MAKRSKRRLVPQFSSARFVDFRYPRPAAVIKEDAEKFLAWREKLQEWKSACRESPDEPPKFPDLNFNPNRGRLTMNQYAKWREAFNAGEAVDEVYAIYQPVDVEIASTANCVCILPGQPKLNGKKPKNWLDEYGEWRPGDVLVGPKHLGFQYDVRVLHRRDIGGFLDEADVNLLMIGSRQYVIGNGGVEGSVVNLLHTSDRGNYRALESQRVAQSTCNIKGLAHLVGLVNNKIMSIKLADDSEMVWLPNQIVTFGYLLGENGEQISPSQIRKMLSDAASKVKMKFEPIPQHSDDYMGLLVPWNDIWKGVQGEMGRKGLEELRERPTRSGESVSNQEKCLTNSKTLMRVHPSGFYCFNLSAIQTGIIPFYNEDAENNRWEGVAIGFRTNIELNITLRESRREEREKPVENAEKAKKKDRSKDDKTTKSSGKNKKVKPAKSDVVHVSSPDEEVLTSHSDELIDAAV